MGAEEKNILNSFMADIMTAYKSITKELETTAEIVPDDLETKIRKRFEKIVDEYGTNIITNPKLTSKEKEKLITSTTFTQVISPSLSELITYENVILLPNYSNKGFKKWFKKTLRVIVWSALFLSFTVTGCILGSSLGSLCGPTCSIAGGVAGFAGGIAAANRLTDELFPNTKP